MAPPRPSFRWDARTGQYHDPATGRFVARAAVRGALDAAIDGAGKEVRATTQALREGTLALRDWQQTMEQNIKHVHLASAAAARGGWAQMTQADFGRCGAAIKEQYGYLRGWVQEIEAGLPLDGRLLVRAEMYIQAGRGIYHHFDEDEQRRRGRTEEKNVLGVADHCEGCLAEDARDWVPLGELVPVGDRLCKSFCHCSVEYR